MKTRKVEDRVIDQYLQAKIVTNNQNYHGIVGFNEVEKIIKYVYTDKAPEIEKVFII